EPAEEQTADGWIFLVAGLAVPELGAAHRPIALLQQADHVAVCELRKFRVVRADGDKRARQRKTKDFVYLRSQSVDRVLGRNRDGEDDPSGSRLSDGAKCRTHSAAGSDPVIDDDDRPAGKP